MPEQDEMKIKAYGTFTPAPVTDEDAETDDDDTSDEEE